MKLDELYKPKISKGVEKTAFDYFLVRANNNSDNWHDERLQSDSIFKKKMEGLGWKYFKGGAYSSVFVNPNKNFVVKTTQNADRGYAHYVDLIKRSRNPHFPKISDKKKLLVPSKPYESWHGSMIQGPDEDYYIYLIEKLYPIDDDQTKTSLAITLSRWFDKVIRYPYMSLKSMSKTFSYEGSIPEILLENKKLVQALRIVGNNRKNFVNDMHSGNIMKRKDGTIVITDPYAG